MLLRGRGGEGRFVLGSVSFSSFIHIGAGREKPRLHTKKKQKNDLQTTERRKYGERKKKNKDWTAIVFVFF